MQTACCYCHLHHCSLLLLILACPLSKPNGPLLCTIEQATAGLRLAIFHLSAALLQLQLLLAPIRSFAASTIHVLLLIVAAFTTCSCSLIPFPPAPAAASNTSHAAAGSVHCCCCSSYQLLPCAAVVSYHYHYISICNSKKCHRLLLPSYSLGAAAPPSTPAAVPCVHSVSCYYYFRPLLSPTPLLLLVFLALLLLPLLHSSALPITACCCCSPLRSCSLCKLQLLLSAGSTTGF